MKNRIQKGYLLPAVIFLGLGISIMSGTFLRFTAISSETLNTQSFESIALEASRSGMNYANSCMEQALDWEASNPLRPNTECDGSGNTGSAYVTTNGTEWRSTFSVAPRDAQNNVVSTGIVEILSGGTVVDTITASTKMNLSGGYTEMPPSTGETVTELSNDYDTCAIANGKLYCWGGSGTPALVGGELSGKTVTHVSVSNTSKCAIGDGIPYCWGDDGSNQLGNGGGWHRTEPSADSPRKDSGPLDGKFVTDISTASFNNPASAIWPFASAFPHTCALTEDGAVSCWGYGGFRQNTGGGQRTFCLIVCGIPVPGFWSYPSYSIPTLTVHYRDNDHLLSGKKSERVGASSHDTCVLSEGDLVCWGVRAPIDLWCNSVLFSDADLTIVPFNLCVANYSNGYTAGGALSGKFIDHNLWNLSANETCHMANRNFVCFGTTPAFGSFWIDSWGAPWTAIGTADVTAVDNGDDVGSMGLVGLYCIVDRGEGKCSGSPFNGNTGSGGLASWKNFLTLNGSSGLAGKIPTKIAAGHNRGCVAANGQLLCWGSGHSTYPSVHGAAVIGTAEGTIAATGQISTGGEHACGVANGRLYCWGENSYGQLGFNNTVDSAQPQSVPSFSSFRSVTDVSAGTDHTCAIVYGDLYCWGRNNNGQLGLGDTVDRDVPVKVDFPSNARVTEVSAGATGTCAVANGRAYCWGGNGSQQVGDGTTTQRTTPTVVTVINDEATTSISMGANHACAVANSDLYCWGSNANGRTGLNTIIGNANPTLVTGGTAGSPTMNGMRPRVSKVSAGNDFTCAVINAKVSCWGNNANGATGRNTTTGNQLIPAVIHGTAGTYYATDISAGDSHTCGLIHGNSSATNGNLWCWGNGADGRIGNGTTNNYTTAQLISCGATMTNHATCTGTRRVATGVDAGSASTCAVANAVIMCWGEGASGRLGNGLLSDSTRPSPSANFRTLGTYEKGPIF